MININTLLTTIFLINICLLTPVNKNNYHLKVTNEFPDCTNPIVQWIPPKASPLSQFHFEEIASSGSTPKIVNNKYLDDNNVYNFTITGEGVNAITKIDYYSYSTKSITDKLHKSLEIIKTQNVILKSDGSGNGTIICDTTISFGSCETSKIEVGMIVITTTDSDNKEIKTNIYVDKCDVTSYSGSNTLPTVKYTQLTTGGKNKLVVNKVKGKRITKKFSDTKISTTKINDDGNKYCNINNINGYYMLFIGNIPNDIIDTNPGSSNTYISIQSTEFYFYNESTTNKMEEKCKIVPKPTPAQAPAQSQAPAQAQTLQKKQQNINLSEEPIVDCNKYNKFNIETDGDNIYHFYLNNYYLGVTSDDKTIKFTKQLYDSIPMNYQWCITELEINKISIININIFIIIIILLLLI